MIESAGFRQDFGRETIRHFISQNDLTKAEIQQVLNSGAALRKDPISRRLEGRSMVMFFEKTSTRTRLSFEIGMTQMGGHAVYLDRDSSQLSRGESIRDTAMVISRYADIVMARVNSHQTLAELARYSSIPVINGLSDTEHPMQSMGDMLTIRERKGRLDGLKVAYVGDGNNNVTHSLMLGLTRMGANLVVASPGELWPNSMFVDIAHTNTAECGGSITVTVDPMEAAVDADVIYTDVWVSMGREAERERRIQLLQPYQVNERLTAAAKPDFIFMHCLPQHVGDEVTEAVAYGQNSVIFDQAENRLHIQKAMVMYLLGESEPHG